MNKMILLNFFPTDFAAGGEAEDSQPNELVWTEQVNNSQDSSFVPSRQPQRLSEKNLVLCLDL